MMTGHFSTITRPPQHPKGRHSDEHREAKRQAAREVPMRFVAIDGEGMDVDGEHRYVLLGVGSHQVENPNGLTWQEIFDFLYKHYQKRTAFVGFFSGSDLSHCVKS